MAKESRPTNTFTKQALVSRGSDGVFGRGQFGQARFGISVSQNTKQARPVNSFNKVALTLQIS